MLFLVLFFDMILEYLIFQSYKNPFLVLMDQCYFSNNFEAYNIIFSGGL
jgi:hypothetical protein